tara:strand:- start:268 stop:423 length:156 start_codon:yes stop_codon:yes gene_type:complete
VVEWEVGELWLQLLDKALSNQKEQSQENKSYVSVSWLCNIGIVPEVWWQQQ